MSLGLAKRITGSLSFPSKMPGTSYALPATACITGAKLAKIPGTACASCYALFGRTNYQRTNPRKAMAYRLKAIEHPLWVEAMSFHLARMHAKRFRMVDMGPAGVRAGSRRRLNEMGFHRWHDSGDLQSVDHLARICEVARRTPAVKHWLPTQELAFVRRFIDGGGTIPPNLLIRVSSIKMDDLRRRAWPHTSTVFADKPPPEAHVCPAPKQGRRCGSCRACWSPDVPFIAYAAH